MTSKQVTHDGSSCTYEDVILTDKSSNSYNHKGLTETKNAAIYAIPELKTHHHSKLSIICESTLPPSSTETAGYISTPVDHCKSCTITTDKTIFSTDSDTDENATISVETGKSAPLYTTVSTSNRSFDTDISMTSKHITHDDSCSAYEDVIFSIGNTSRSYDQNDHITSNNDSVCVASEQTTHDYFSNTQEVTISTNKTTMLFNNPRTIGGIDNQSIRMAAGKMTPPVPLANHDMSLHIICNNQNTGDHNRMSILGDDIMPLFSFDNNNELVSDDSNDESLPEHEMLFNADEYDYDVRSISSTETILQDCDDRSSYGDSLSPVNCETSLSCHPTGMFDGDCDRISIAGDEMALQDPDELSENESTNVDVILADDGTSEKSYRNLRSSLLDDGYENIPKFDSCYGNTSRYGHDTRLVVASETTPHHFDEMSEHALTNVDNTGDVNAEGYEDVFPLTEQITRRNPFDGNASKHADDTVSKIISEMTLQHSDETSENVSTDVLVGDTTTARDHRNLESSLLDQNNGYVFAPTDNCTSSYVNRRSETDGYVCVPVDDNTSSYVNNKFENPLTHGYASVPIDDYASSYVNEKSQTLLTDDYGDVLSATDIIFKHNGNGSKDAYDAVSTVSRQTLLQHSDKADNAAMLVNDTLVAKDQASSQVNRKHSNRNVVGEVTQNYSPNIIQLDYINIPSLKNGTENTFTDQYDTSLNRDKRTTELSSATILESTLENDYDDISSRAASTISGLENASKCETSESISKDLNDKVVDTVTQGYCLDKNADYIIMRSGLEKSRTTSKDFYGNVVGEVTSSDVNVDYTNIPCHKRRLVDITTDGYDTLIKVDKTTTECNSTAMSSSTSVNDCVEITSITDNTILGLENTSVDNHCENVPVTSASVALIKIAEVITCSCYLQCLEISDCRLSDPQVAIVATALSKRSTLRHLDLSYNQIVTDSTALKMASVIKSNLSLKNLNLSNCHLQESGIKIISKALVRLTSLVSIDMSKNKITYNSMKYVAAAIIGLALLEQLNFSHCFEYDGSTTSTEEVNHILVTLTRFTSLKHLDIHSNYLNDDTSKLLPVVILNNNKSLSYLDLTDCKLQSTDFVFIANKLQSTFILKCLILSSNIITNETAHELALAIGNLSLQHLALSDCKIEETGLLDIAESLLNVSSLKHLDLSYNSITDKIAVTLASSIANNTLLVYLSLIYCIWQSNASYKRIHMVVSELPLLKEFEF